jgi:uncharacterized protein (DUF1778 family)
MQPATYTPKKSRFEARITEEQKALFLRAAAYGGHRTLTEFIISSAQEKADALIREHEILHLTAEDRRIFVDALLHPPEPNEKLRRAAERYKEYEA